MFSETLTEIYLLKLCDLFGNHEKVLVGGPSVEAGVGGDERDLQVRPRRVRVPCRQERVSLNGDWRRQRPFKRKYR